MKRRDEHISPSLKGLRVESINKKIPIAQLKESPGTDGLTCFFKRKISAARRVRTGDHSTPQSKTILLPASDPGHSPRPFSSQPRTQATVQDHSPPSLGPRPQSKTTLLPASDPGHSPRPPSSQPRTQATVQGHPPPSQG